MKRWLLAHYTNFNYTARHSVFRDYLCPKEVTLRSIEIINSTVITALPQISDHQPTAVSGRYWAISAVTAD